MTAKDSLFRAGTSLHRAIFTATKGRVLGRGLGMPMLILSTTGRSTGKKRDTMLTTPLTFDDTVVIVASYGGDDREPAWCRNLRDNPAVEITMRGSKRAMKARIAEGDERADLWRRLTSAHQNYAGYQRKTDREIPVVVCEPA